MNGILLWSLVWDSTCLRAAKSASCNYWSPCALEPVLCTRRGLCNERPVHHNWRETPLHLNQRKLCSAHFIVQLSHPYMTTGKTIALTRQTFIDKIMSLLLNMLSTLVITFLPWSKRLLTSWLQSPSAVILEPRKIVSHCCYCFPIYFPWSDGTGCHDLSFLNVEL